MAAGLGFKDFTTGEVLTAADVDGYLMQGVWVFASAAARDAAVTSPQEGNFAYLKDTNVTTYYTGSAWANLDTTGMTNPMTTTGDTIYASSGSTPARLGIGSTGQVLTVAGGIPSWATPAGGGDVVKIGSTTTFTSAATIDLDGIFTSTYTNYTIYINYTAAASGDNDLLYYLRASGSNTTTNYEGLSIALSSASFGTSATSNRLGGVATGSTGYHTIVNVLSPQLAQYTMVNSVGHFFNSDPALRYFSGNTGQKSTTQFDGIRFYSGSGATMTGTVTVYGWNK